MTTIDRRGFLKGCVGFSAALALRPSLLLPKIALAAPGSAGDTLICIFLRGGADGLNIVVPHGDGAYYAQRPTIAIPTPRPGAIGAALDLDGFFGLHPALAPLHELYAAQKLALVHAVGSPDPTRSHFDAMEYMELGVPGVKTTAEGWIGRHLASLGGSRSTFSAVGLGSHVQRSLRGSTPALAMESIASFHLQGHEEHYGRVRAALANMYSCEHWLHSAGRETLAALAEAAQLQQAEYSPRHGARYPETQFAQQMASVAQLIQAGVGVQAACLDLDGWDTHEYQGGADGQMAAVLEELGATLHALYTDLADLMGGVTVVVMSEFGRRLAENGSAGTDHGHGSAMLVLGDNIAGGKVYGSWPGLESDALDDGDLAITTDYRTVLGEIVSRRLGNPRVDAVFPNFQLTPLGLSR